MDNQNQSLITEVEHSREMKMASKELTRTELELAAEEVNLEMTSLESGYEDPDVSDYGKDGEQIDDNTNHAQSNPDGKILFLPILSGKEKETGKILATSTQWMECDELPDE